LLLSHSCGPTCCNKRAHHDRANAHQNESRNADLVGCGIEVGQRCKVAVAVAAARRQHGGERGADGEGEADEEGGEHDLPLPLQVQIVVRAHCAQRFCQVVHGRVLAHEVVAALAGGLDDVAQPYAEGVRGAGRRCAARRTVGCK
jgi:hypothetical protein